MPDTTRARSSAPPSPTAGRGYSSPTNGAALQRVPAGASVEATGSTLPTISTASSLLPALPPVTSPAWNEPATEREARYAAAWMLNVVEPQADPSRAALMGNLLASYGYTRAELYLAMRELPRRNNFGQGFRLDLVDEVIRAHRQMRGRLRQALTVAQMQDLCATGEVDPDRFRICGYDDRNNPLFRYCPDLPAVPIRPAPEAATVEPPQALLPVITNPTGESDE